MRQRGFTLLEILVVLAVFGLLLAGLSQTVRFGLLAWRQEARMSGGKTDLEAVDRSLRAIIENFVPADEAARSAIVGTSNELTGVTRLRVPGSGLEAIPIEAGLAVSGTRLVLRWRPYHHGDPLRPPSPPQETELVNGVARLAISYWQSAGIWTSAWKQPELPLLIRLHLTFTGEHPVRWPDIVVAPLLSRP
jgi:general secretion pathway protein J